MTADGRSFLCNSDMFLKQMVAGLFKYSQPQPQMHGLCQVLVTCQRGQSLVWLGFVHALFILFCGSFETGFPYVAVAGLELAMWARLAWNLLNPPTSASCLLRLQGCNTKALHLFYYFSLFVCLCVTACLRGSEDNLQELVLSSFEDRVIAGQELTNDAKLAGQQAQGSASSSGPISAHHHIHFLN